MHRLIYFVFIFTLLSSIHLGLCSDSSDVILKVEEDNNLDDEDTFSLLTSTTTTTTTAKIEPIVEDVIVNVTEPAIITATTTTIINEKQAKQFHIEYPLNVNLSSSSSLSNITFNPHLNDTILILFEEHKILLINKNDGTIKKYFEYGKLIPVNQQTEQSNFVFVFDDNTQELWTLNSNEQQKHAISFKPKRIHIFPSANNLWVAETSDEVALYVSEDSGRNWKRIADSSSSIVLGWSNKTNSIVILQHSHYIKLIDRITSQIKPILTDVSSTKLFSRYLLSKRSNTNNLITISHVNNLANEGFRSFPKRLQSQGNFYCAIEDINTQDLLLLFIADNRLGETNETILSTCSLVSYSKQNLLNLTNIDCNIVGDDSLSNSIECSTAQLPLYQVRGLSKSIYLANVAPGPSTVVSFDGGITWNKTHYECDKMMNCPNNVSIVISSLLSSNEAPGIIFGKASDGVNEYVAVSSNAGRLWKLSSKGNDSLTAISYPNALVLTVPNNGQSSLNNNSFLYSTDYGRNWHEKTVSNNTSHRLISLMADKNNVFYGLTSNNENNLNLSQLDFNNLITEPCARHQVKEWSLHGGCVNGSKSYYKRLATGSHCLNNISEVRSEPCSCSLSDFKCAPGYKRSKDGLCLPRSHYIFSQDCTCNVNNSLLTKPRGYVKSMDSQCRNGIENFLSDAYISQRDPNNANLLTYGIDSNTKRTTVQIHTNDFDHSNYDDDDDDDDDEDEDGHDLTQNTVWSVDSAYEITGLAFNESNKQIYVAVEYNKMGIIYRVAKNLREQHRASEQITFDPNNELYKSRDERIEHLALDWSTQNLYVLVRNKKTNQQTVFVLDVRTHKRRTIIKSQQIQPPIILVDSTKAELYWISHNSPSIFNIGNLQGEIKKQVQLFGKDANINYVSYDPITHEIIFIINSTIYGLNTLDHHRLTPRVIYEHSSSILNPLFVHPILYFTTDNTNENASHIHLHTIDILSKSFAKNIAKFKHIDSLKLFVDMAPTMPVGSTPNQCANNPCSDICIPLAHGKFHCVCSDDARYQSCSCPTEERFIAGGCQAKNEKCAPGRVLCQNRLNCAESARACEQDHTQYTESFKTTARCTIEKPDDGFDCYYTDAGIHGPNSTCIPFEWLCDGVYDCPMGNDEEHCYKMTTTRKPPAKVAERCLTEKKFTHVMCNNKCMKIYDVCRNSTFASICPEQFHLNCKRTHDKNQYECKCFETKTRCIAMIEHCDDYEHCEQVCADSIHYAKKKGGEDDKTSSTVWIILVIAILLILLIAIIVMTLRYMRQRKNAKKAPTPSRTPVPVAPQTVNSSPSDAREKLLNNTSSTANETS